MVVALAGDAGTAVQWLPRHRICVGVGQKRAYRPLMLGSFYVIHSNGGGVPGHLSGFYMGIFDVCR